MTDSFEKVYDRVYPQLHNPCALWKAATIREWLDDLMTAHERELARARDPQRLRGTKPNTFDGAIEALREFRWQHATNDEDAVPYINAVKEAHDRELERRTREQYARGYEDGRRSMDARHYAVALKLNKLTFDGNHHGNLSKIAYVVYPCATGWTCESSEGLRDELVRLLGGVHDEHLANIWRTSGELDENGEFCEIEPRNTVESSKYAENYKSGHITDELRKWTGIDVWSCKWEEFDAIADRIDEQFARVCEQQEAVLQQTIERMADENLMVKNERDYLRRQRDELQAKLDEIKGILDGR